MPGSTAGPERFHASAHTTTAQRASVQTFPPPPGGTLAPIEAALSKLVIAYTLCADDALVAQAYRKTIRARGIDALVAGGGREALEYLAQRLVEAEPAQADNYMRILDEAWLALPGWQS